jgi:two-component system, chemotaxis family, sensor kinase CheA
VTPVDPADTFRQEAQELLDQLEQALLDLEHSPDDTGLIDSAFRALHTIKGSGAMFGFDAVAAFTHHVETAFDLVRKGKVPPSPALIAVTLAAKDRMRLLIEQPDTADMSAGDAILENLKAIVEGSGVVPMPGAAAGGATAPAVGPGSGSGPVTWRIRFRLATDAMAMGTNPLLLLDELRAMGSATIVARTDGVLPLQDMAPTDCHFAWDVVLSTTRTSKASFCS